MSSNQNILLMHESVSRMLRGYLFSCSIVVFIGLDYWQQRKTKKYSRERVPLCACNQAGSFMSSSFLGFSRGLFRKFSGRFF